MEFYTIALLISNVIGFFVVERMLGIFYEERRTSLPIMLFSFLVVYIMFNVEHFLFLHHPMHIRGAVETVVSLTGYFLLTLNYKSSIVKRLIVTVAIFFLFIAIGMFAAIALAFDFIAIPYSIYYEEEILTLILLFYIASLPLAYLITTLLRRFKNIRKNETFHTKTFVVPVLMTLVLLYPMWSSFAYMLDLSLPWEVNIILIGVYMMGATFLIFYLYDTLSAAYRDKLQSALQSQEKEYYFAQSQLMQESVDKVKSIQHDMKLHLATAKKYVASNKVNEAADYLDSLLSSVEESEVYSDTGNIAFDSIINFKLNEAKAHNVKLDITMHIPQTLGIEIADVVTILGNLLDNALDAVAKIDDKKIKLDIYYDKGGLFINISNAFDGEVTYVKGQAGDKNGIASRKTEKEHGYGLKNIRKSVEKYNSDMDINYEGNIFSVEILVYVGDNMQA